MTNNLFITERGMVSSLGGNREGCAAHRAGITRPKELSLSFSMEDDPNPVPVIGYPCKFAETFEGYGRLAYLVYLAIVDLMKRNDRDLPNLVNSGIIYVLPKSNERPLLTEQELDLEEDGDSLFIKMLYQLIPEWRNIPVLEIIRDGHAGAFQAIKKANDMIIKNKTNSCFIAAADSYIDLPSLEWLFSTKQLKAPGESDGLMPGEGASIILIEKSRQKHCSVNILGVTSGKEHHSSVNEQKMQTGKLLYRISEQVLSDCETIDNVYLISDINGQSARAIELGNFLVKLKGKFPNSIDLQVVTPASSFGDVGAATGLFFICVAVNAFERGCAKKEKALIVTSSYSEKRSCLLLHTTKN